MAGGAGGGGGGRGRGRGRGDLVALHLAVDGVGLALHAADGAEHKHRAVEHAQGALDLDREVDVPGRVDDVDLVLLPPCEGRCRLDRDALLALQVHAVHLGPDAVLATHLPPQRTDAQIRRGGFRAHTQLHRGWPAGSARPNLVNFVDAARVEEDALRQRGLARVDMC
jgi:hypothetical protein